MDELMDILKDKGIRITPQRLRVYEILYKERKHLTAEQIYERIRKNLPAISFATVYSILDAFKEKNLVKELRIRFDCSFFDARIEPHHHFFCRVCSRTFDLDIPLCDTLREGGVGGYVIEDFQGYFYGICKECNNKR